MRWASSIARWTDAIDAFTAYIYAAGLLAGTIEKRRYQLTRFAEQHLRRSPWRITHGELITWLSASAWAPETLRSYRSALRSFYAWEKLSGHVKCDPTERRPTVRAPKVAPRLTPDQTFAAAIEHATDRARLILKCAAYAGMRRAEIACRRWDDVGADSIRVHGKGTTPDPIGRTAARALAGTEPERATLDRAHPAAPVRHPHAYALGGRDILAVQDVLGHERPENQPLLHPNPGRRPAGRRDGRLRGEHYPSE